MSDALISVIVPCYNHGRFLGEALASIGQPAVRTEIVVVDDGSTDSTPEVTATFETANQFRCIRQQNAGLAAARNRGLRESRGRYLIFLDADDRLAPGAVDLAVSKLEEHPECAFVFGRAQMMDGAGRLQPTPEQPRIVRDHYRELLRRNYIWMPAMVIFRREPLERIGGFNGHVNAAADYEIYLHLSRHYPVFDHGQLVAHYRKHDASMSVDAGRMLRETLSVMRSQRPFLEGDEASLAAYEDGWRGWQEYYGAHLVNEIGGALRGYRWLEAMTKAAILGVYHPRGLWLHTRRKGRNMLDREDRRYAGRAIPAAEISEPTTRASSTPGNR